MLIFFTPALEFSRRYMNVKFKAALQLSLVVTIKVVGDTGYERIHKEKKVQRVKVLFLLSQGRARAGCGGVQQPQH